MKSLFSVFFLFIIYASFSQENKTIDFTVFNEKNELVSDAYFQFAENGQYLGVSTNGSLSITFEELPLRILVTHISYETQEIIIDKQSPNPLTIRLKTKNVSLSAVSITSKIKEVNDITAENIKDYILTEHGILMLLSSGQKNKLKLLSDDSNNKQYLSIKSGAKQLFRDCRGLIHLIFEDSIQRVEYFHGDLILTEKNSFSDFTKYILPCEITEGETIIRFIQEEENQANTFLISHAQPPKFTIMRQMFDLNMRQRIYEEKGMLSGVSASEANSNFSLGEIRKRQRDYDFFNFIIKKDLYTPLFKKGQNLFIFDHYNDSLVTFNMNGEKIKSQYISYHLSDDFRPNHLQDESTGDIYITMRHKRVYFLYLFDFESLEISKTIKISKPFPMNLKVKDGKLYYLARDLTAEHKNYRLYSEKL